MPRKPRTGLPTEPVSSRFDVAEYGRLEELAETLDVDRSEALRAAVALAHLQLVQLGKLGLGEEVLAELRRERAKLLEELKGGG